MAATKKLSISMDAIKKRIFDNTCTNQSTTIQNLSHSLIDRVPLHTPDIVHTTSTDALVTYQASTDTFVNTHQQLVDNPSTPDSTLTTTTVIKIIPPLNSMHVQSNSPKSKSKTTLTPTSTQPQSTEMANLPAPYTSKYLTQINKQKIPSNSDGKAMSLTVHLCGCKSIHIKIFHISWITLFTAWFCSFSLHNLTVHIRSDLHSNTASLCTAMVVQSFSTLIFSILFGDLCDKIGARYSYCCLLIISFFCFIVTILLSYNSVSFIILSFFTGIIGASFVITQYHITSFFSSKCVGIANGLSAGWASFMAMFAALNLKIICDVFYKQSNVSRLMSWRLSLLIPALLLFVMIFIYYFYTIDSPKGNISKERISKKLIFTFQKYKWKRIASDYRIWILALSYCISCGIRMTVLNYFVDYISITFDAARDYAQYILLIMYMTSLFDRGFGGYLSDLLYLKYGIQGRIYCLFFALLFEAAFLFLFAMSAFHFGFTILMVTFFIIYVQIAEGIVFAIVPNLPHQKYIGLCMGIIAGGGNFGTMFGSLLFVQVPGYIGYQTAWMSCSLFVLVASFAVLFVKFTRMEIQNDLKNTATDFWTCMGTEFKPVKEDGGKNTVGFVIH